MFIRLTSDEFAKVNDLFKGGYLNKINAIKVVRDARRHTYISTDGLATTRPGGPLQPGERMGEAPVLTGKLVRVNLRNVLITKEDRRFEGKVGLVIGRDNSVRSWHVLIDDEVARFNRAFLEVIDEEG